MEATSETSPVAGERVSGGNPEPSALKIVYLLHSPGSEFAVFFGNIEGFDLREFGGEIVTDIGNKAWRIVSQNIQRTVEYLNSLRGVVVSTSILNADFRLRMTDTKVFITNNKKSTYIIKDELKKRGWRYDLGVWQIPRSKVDAIVETIEYLKQNYSFIILG